MVTQKGDWLPVTAEQMKRLQDQIDAGEIDFFRLRELLEHRDPFAVSFIDWHKTYG